MGKYAISGPQIADCDRIHFSNFCYHSLPRYGVVQKVGELLGEITAFCILYNGIHYEEESRRIIFFTVGALVFVIGLLVSRLMVRE